ncbi:MAG: hypothetical protein NC182_05605 [Prevotella sp.]|nr:hypothetical protein [Staphylococcus sp.]MCM1350661.1 hypothetical protein [Prevotella sp.]
MTSVFVLPNIVVSLDDIFTANAQISIFDLSFISNSKTQYYKIMIANGTIKEIVIPSTYEDLFATMIDDSEFIGCSLLEKMIITFSIKTIKNNSFSMCFEKESLI